MMTPEQAETYGRISAFPIPGTVWTGMSTFEYFVAHAPDVVPDWFAPGMEREERYFKWRTYYATMVIRYLDYK